MERDAPRVGLCPFCEGKEDKTPHEILARLNRAVAAAVSEPELYKRFIERGIELKASASPEEFSAYIRAEFEKKKRLAQEAGIRPE